MSQRDRLASANTARAARHAIKSTMYGLSAANRGNSRHVHRNSQYAGEVETRAWKRHNVFGAAERRARTETIKAWNYREKKKGESWGPLGPNGERFLDGLMGLRCFKTGRLDYSIRTIADKLCMCVQTVISYIARLEGLGLLVKLRRSVPIADPEPGGPRVEQITNAYWFTLPPELAERVRQLLAKGGKPVDQEEHERAQADAVAEMLASLSTEELAAFHAGDTGPLAERLKALGRALDKHKGDSNRSNVTPVEKVK